MWARISHTKSLVNDYAKTWSGNRSVVLKDLVANHLAFLDPLVNDPFYDQIRELRNTVVSHIERYEGLGITVAGTTTKNAPDPPPQQNVGTLDEVFVPVRARVESKKKLWWINNKAKLGHAQTLELTEAELKVAAKEFLELSFEHIHLLKNLPDLFQVHEYDKQGQNVDAQ